jgi:hypothetical protein
VTSLRTLPRRAWGALRRYAAAPVRALAWLKPAEPREALFLIGLAMLFAGGRQVYPPAGWLLAGAVLVWAVFPRRGGA